MARWYESAEVRNLHFDHRFKGLDGEGIPPLVRRDRDEPTRRMCHSRFLAGDANSRNSIAGLASGPQGIEKRLKASSTGQKCCPITVPIKTVFSGH